MWTNVIGSLQKQINIHDLALLYQALKIQTTHVSYVDLKKTLTLTLKPLK